MTLQYHDDSGAPATCIHCGAQAAGPCARCDAPLCGDCCVITEGGTKPYAICRGCAGETGASLGGGWLTVIGWVLLPIAALVAILIALGLIFG